MSQTVATCHVCGRGQETRRVSTTVPGSAPVDVLVCPQCDRRQCETCKGYVASPTARTCSCGRVL